MSAYVAEEEKRSTDRIFAQSIMNGGMEAVEAFTHVAWFEGDKYFEAATETKHGIGR